MVAYNDEAVSLKTLLRQFFKIIDPVSLNRQGLDEGRQYRTGIYYIDESDLKVINEVFEDEQHKYEQTIVTERKPLENFVTTMKTRLKIPVAGTEFEFQQLIKIRLS